ncbi:MAG: radical SAM protein [Sphingomonadaceae bacterium]
MSVITHGCRSNLAEADALARWAGPGVTVINSCAVTAEAVRDARRSAKKALQAGRPVWITGCAQKVAPERLADLPVRLVDKPWLSGAATLRARGFVAIQDGCEHHCTFCVTRLARGPARSAPPADVVEAVRTLVAQGAREVVLTGVDACHWGQDLAGRPRLGGLVEAVLKAVPELPRLRLSTLDPAAVDDGLVALFAEPRLMPHLHLSLQSGDDLILKRMRRRHRAADAVRLVEAVRRIRPDVAVGADLIAGFPTESDSAHANSLAIAAACGVVHAHVFPFSPRPGTVAARMPQLPRETARARAADIRAQAEARKAAWLQAFVGKEVDVVSEGAKGLSPHFAEVQLATPLPRGQLAGVRVKRVAQGVLIA